MSPKSQRDQKVVMGYLGLAHRDYVAARHLLKHGFLEHGCMLAATSLEKHLKAVIGIHGLSKTDHLGGNLYKLVKSCQPALFAALDLDFLKFLEKTYRLRYASVSAPGLAIVINQYRSLITLDRIIADIDKGFTIVINDKPSPTPFRHSVESRDEAVIDDNVAVDPSLLGSILSRNNRVLELKIENDFGGLRVEYQTAGVNMAGPFTKLPEVSSKKTQFKVTGG